MSSRHHKIWLPIVTVNCLIVKTNYTTLMLNLIKNVLILKHNKVKFNILKTVVPHTPFQKCTTVQCINNQTFASDESKSCWRSYAAMWRRVWLCWGILVFLLYWLPYQDILFYSNLKILRCWIPNPGVLCSKPVGGSKVNSAFHPSEVDKMSSRNFWKLSDKK